MKSKLVGTLAVLMALGNISYCIPLPAHAGESEASSEAGLYAPTIPRGRRRGRYRGNYNQQPQQTSTYLTSTGAPMTPGPAAGQGQGRRNGNGQRRGQHAQIRNYGAGRGKRPQQPGGSGGGGGGNQNGVQNTIPVQSTLPGNPTARTSTP